MSFGSPIVYVAALGMLLFQMPTGVILVTIVAGFPGKPAFAFGMTCLALMAGAFPVFTQFGEILRDPWIAFGLVVASTAALWIGLRSAAAPTKLSTGQAC